jgi:hypothetical protein
MPAKLESNLFVKCATQFEGNRSCDSIGKWYDAFDLQSHFMLGVGEGPDAALLRDASDVIVTQETAARDGAKGTDRFPHRNLHEIGTMNTAYSCTHGIENEVVGATKLANTEVPWTFVKSKVNVHGSH